MTKINVKPCQRCGKDRGIKRVKFCDACAAETMSERKSKLTKAYQKRIRDERRAETPCQMCGGPRPVGRVKYCDPCAFLAQRHQSRMANRDSRARKKEEDNAKAKVLAGIGCATCISGEELAFSETGWICKANVSRDCGPLGPRRWWKQK